jgi:hypothetical protein
MIKLGAQDSWTKSSYSTGNGACIEVRSTEPTLLAVSDSKETKAADRTHFSVSPSAFSAFVGFAATAQV